MLKPTAVERPSLPSMYLPCLELTCVKARFTIILTCNWQYKMHAAAMLQAQPLKTRSYPVALLQAYEARLNPFVEFQQHETESHVNKLNLHDRALLSGSR